MLSSSMCQNDPRTLTGFNLKNRKKEVKEGQDPYRERLVRAWLAHDVRLVHEALVQVLAFVQGGKGGLGARLAADLAENNAIRNQKKRRARCDGKEPC